MIDMPQWAAYMMYYLLGCVSVCAALAFIVREAIRGPRR